MPNDSQPPRLMPDAVLAAFVAAKGAAEAKRLLNARLRASGDLAPTDAPSPQPAAQEKQDG